MSYSKNLLYLLSTSVLFAASCKTSTSTTQSTTNNADTKVVATKVDTIPNSNNTVNLDNLLPEEEIVTTSSRGRQNQNTVKTGETIKEGKSAMDEDLPLNPAVRTGVLPNGMRYYVQQNGKPENRVELRLAVNAGSMQEDDNQLGLAHFVEHMAFNGTTNFEKNNLVSFLENTGVRFGADLNAYTSFDETVYMLQLPTDKKGMVDTGLLVMSDWATGIAFEDVEIDKERGVIESEWRTGLGAGERLRNQYWHKLFYQSRYANRLPIGDVSIIKTAPYERFRTFYKDWYRPNLMSIIVVGDINPEEVEKKIVESFSKLQNPATPRQKEVAEVPNHKETLVAIATDKEAPGIEAEVIYKHPATSKGTVKDFRTSLVNDIFNGMFQARFDELAQDKNAPFYSAGAGYGAIVRAKDAYYLSVKPKDKTILAALEMALIEQNRVLQHGFTEPELERQKLEILKYAEKAAKEQDKTNSANLAMKYVQHFLTKNPAMDAKQELQMTKNFIEAITLDDVNGLLEKWLTDENRAVVITAPQKPSVILPTEAEVLNVFDKVKTVKTEAYKDKYADMPLFEKELKAGNLTATKELGVDKLKLTEYTFSNGIKVAVYPTTHNNDQILMYGFSNGGHSLYNDQEFLTASLAAQMITEAGVGKFDAIALDRKMTGKTVSVAPFIDDISEGFQGSSSVADFESLLQLVHLYATNPRKNQDDFDRSMEQLKEQMANLLNNPTYYFYDQMIRAQGNNHPRKYMLPSVEALEKINYDRLFEIYKERFHDLSDFTFVFVGNIDKATALPLITKYIGSLPGKGRKENYKDVGIKANQKLTEINLKKGISPQANVALLFSKEMKWTMEDAIKVDAMGRILNIMVRENLREDKGGVYSPQVASDFDALPTGIASALVLFQCAPENAKMLIDAVKEEVTALQKTGGTEENLNKVKEIMVRERESNIQKNQFWLQRINSYYQGISKLEDYTKYNDIVKNMTQADIIKMATAVLELNKVTILNVSPEDKP